MQDFGEERRNFTMHMATMTDLLPNEIYYYVVGGALATINPNPKGPSTQKSYAYPEPVL